MITFLILKFLGMFMSLRMPDEALEIGDVAAHDEEAYPEDTLVSPHAGPTRPPTRPPASTASPPAHRADAEPGAG